MHPDAENRDAKGGAGGTVNVAIIMGATDHNLATWVFVSSRDVRSRAVAPLRGDSFELPVYNEIEFTSRTRRSNG